MSLDTEKRRFAKPANAFPATLKKSRYYESGDRPGIYQGTAGIRESAFIALNEKRRMVNERPGNQVKKPRTPCSDSSAPRTGRGAGPSMHRRT